MPLVASTPNREGGSSEASRACGGSSFVPFVVILAAVASLLAVLPVHALTLTVTPARSQGPGGAAGAPAEIRATGSFLAGASEPLAATLQTLER